MGYGLGGFLKLRWLAALLLLAGCTVAPEQMPSTATNTSERRQPTSTTSPPTTTASTDAPTTTDTVSELTTYLVWTSGGLTDELVSGLEATFDQISIVTGDAAELDVGDGQVVPIDAVGIDVVDHAVFDPSGEISELAPGSVILGESSAAHRGMGVGDTMTFDGVTFPIVAVVSDEVAGWSEVVFDKADDDAPVSTNRYALIQTDLDRATFETTVTQLNDGPVPARIRAEAETPWLRHADGTLPQILIKQALGEFSYPAGSTAELIQDEEFLAENIVTVDMPVFGRVTCHRVVVEMLEGALAQISEEGLAGLIDPGEFAGCWNARFINTLTGVPSGVSRHSWGGAIDINAGSNRLGTKGSMDPRLVEIMKEWGFIWGGDWTVPDPMHFEYGIRPDR